MGALHPWRYSNCAACATLSCCHAYNVNILGRDAYRIARQLDLPAQLFAGYVEQREPDLTGFLLAVGGPRHMLTLGKREQGARPEGWPCIFLMELPEGLLRCGLYEARPHVCRVYPGSMFRSVVQLRRKNLCPVPTYDLGKVDVGRWRAELCDNRIERDVHQAVIGVWNDRVVTTADRSCTFSEVLDFLANVYHATEPSRPASGEPWARVRERWNALLDEGYSPLGERPSGGTDAARAAWDAAFALPELAGFVRALQTTLAPLRPAAEAVTAGHAAHAEALVKAAAAAGTEAAADAGVPPAVQEPTPAPF